MDHAEGPRPVATSLNSPQSIGWMRHEQEKPDEKEASFGGSSGAFQHSGHRETELDEERYDQC